MISTKPYDAINEAIVINAPVAEVWKHLTTIELIKTWMLDTDMQLEINTNWQVGSPILFKGNLHHTPFENKGTIVQYQKEKMVEYTHLSSLSKLPYTPENFCHITFELSSQEQASTLTLTISNFPTESIYKHMKFYWKTAIEVLRKQVEKI
jgi:uncharacterized protein YndB with AHSA1/START domain